MASNGGCNERYVIGGKPVVGGQIHPTRTQSLGHRQLLASRTRLLTKRRQDVQGDEEWAGFDTCFCKSARERITAHPERLLINHNAEQPGRRFDPRGCRMERDARDLFQPTPILLENLASSS